MTLEEKVKQLELENMRLKRKLINLQKDYNSLHAMATSLNTQVKEYRTLANNVCDKLNKQLDVTETYVLNNIKNIKEEM